MKLYWKYSLLLGLLLVLAAGSVTAVALQHHRGSLTREALLRAESIAVNLALVSAEAILTRDVLQLLPLSTDATTRHEAVIYAAVTDQKGLVLAHPDRGALRKPLQIRELGEDVRHGLQARVAEAEGLGRRLWDVSVPVKAKGSLVELGRAHVGLDRRSIEDAVRRSLTQLLVVALLCLALGLGLALWAVRLLVKPVQALSRASAQVGRGDFAVRVQVGGKDEIKELASNFNQMVTDLKLAEERRKAALRVESELEVAHSIQKDLLPNRAPDMPGWEVAFHCTPATELGGDYYDWYPVAGGRRWGFVVADVSGKGVPAALHMANLRNLMRFSTAQVEEPAALLARVNDLAFPDLVDKAFVTMAYLVLDPATGALAYANAGHDPVLLLRADGSQERLDSHTFPVGVVEGELFAAKAAPPPLTLQPGDLAFLYTDGVTEAEDDQGRQFGIERITTLLQGCTAPQAVQRVLEALKEHTQGRPPHDDVTLLALRRLGPL